VSNGEAATVQNCQTTEDRFKFLVENISEYLADGALRLKDDEASFYLVNSED
jgi:hypothetical protein